MIVQLAESAASFAAFFLYASFFEWILHRFLMHQPLWSYPFRSHALVHHGIFRAGPTYFLSRDENRKQIRFAWWNAPLILGLHAPVVLWGQYFFNISIFFGGMTALALYYFLYEYLHFCMHVPNGRWFEKTVWFCWLDAHHHMHHKRHFNNLNVVLPLADLIFGTLVPARERIPAQRRPANFHHRSFPLPEPYRSVAHGRDLRETSRGSGAGPEQEG